MKRIAVLLAVLLLVAGLAACGGPTTVLTLDPTPSAEPTPTPVPTRTPMPTPEPGVAPFAPDEDDGSFRPLPPSEVFAEAEEEAGAEEEVEEEEEDPEESAAPEPTATPEEVTYILNTNSRKFHNPSCSSVNQIKESNKQEYTGTRDDLIARGYTPCGRCDP